MFNLLIKRTVLNLPTEPRLVPPLIISPLWFLKLACDIHALSYVAIK